MTELSHKLQSFIYDTLFVQAMIIIIFMLLWGSLNCLYIWSFTSIIEEYDLYLSLIGCNEIHTL